MAMRMIALKATLGVTALSAIIATAFSVWLWRVDSHVDEAPRSGKILEFYTADVGRAYRPSQFVRAVLAVDSGGYAVLGGLPPDEYGVGSSVDEMYLSSWQVSTSHGMAFEAKRSPPNPVKHLLISMVCAIVAALALYLLFTTPKSKRSAD